MNHYEPKTFSRANIVVISAVLGTVGCFILPLIAPWPRLWGVDSLRFLSPTAMVAPLALFALALCVTITPRLRDATRRWLSAVGGKMFAPGGVWLRVGAIGVAGALFYAFRAPTHFLGDGYQQLTNFSENLTVIAAHPRFTSYGYTHLLAFIQSWFSVPSPDSARFIFQSLSVLSGVAAIYFAGGIARVIVSSPIARATTFLSLTLSPVMLLWFGYVEYYPLLWASLLAYLWLALRSLSAGKGTGWAVITLCGACLIHLSALAYGFGVMALAYGVVDQTPRLRHLGQHARIFGRIALAIGVLVIVVAAWRGPEWSLTLLGLSSSVSCAPGYTVFSAAHLADIANEFALVWPAGLLWLGLALIGRKRSGEDPIDRFLLLTAVGAGAFLLLIRPGLGMARDWDLFSFTIFPIALFAMRRVLTVPTSRLAPYAAGVLLIGAGATAAYVIVNLSKESSALRFETLLDIDPGLSRTGRFILSQYQRDHGDFEEADATLARMNSQFPEYLAASRALDLIDDGKLDEARRLDVYVWAADSTAADALILRAKLFQATGAYDSALAHLERAERQIPGTKAVYIYKSELLVEMGRPDEGLALAEEGAALYPDNFKLRRLLANQYLIGGAHDRAAPHARALLTIAPENATGYLSMLYIKALRKEYDSSRYYLREYSARGAHRGEYSAIMSQFRWLSDSAQADDSTLRK